MQTRVVLRKTWFHLFSGLLPKTFELKKKKSYETVDLVACNQNYSPLFLMCLYKSGKRPKGIFVMNIRHTKPNTQGAELLGFSSLENGITRLAAHVKKYLCHLA